MVHISKEIFQKMLRLEERPLEQGGIPQGSAYPAAMLVIAERGIEACMRGYHGDSRMNDAWSAAREEQAALDASDTLVADIRKFVRTQEATHTTSDFPLALANLRIRAVREPYTGEQSNWRDFASVITVPDFKPIRTLRFDEAAGLLLRPEGTDVKYMTLTEREDGYRVSNFERAIQYTWEMWKNDEWGRWVKAMASFGRAARRTEAIVVLTAIRDGVAREPLTAGPGAPTIDRLIEMEGILADRTFNETGGIAVNHGFRLSDVIHGTKERHYIATLLKQEYRDFQGGTPNPMEGAFTAHYESLWQGVLGRDIVGYDNNYDWLEVAFLEGFESGPKTYVKLPTSRDYPEEGDFEDHALSAKMGHTLGAKVIEPQAAIRAQGAA